MKTESDKQKFVLFIGCLVGIALLINFFFLEIAHSYRAHKEQAREQVRQQQESQIAAQKAAEEKEQLQKQREADALQATKDAEIARQKAAEEAAAEHAQYMARYLDSSFVRKPNIETVAIVAVSEDGKWDSNIGDALSHHLKANGIEILPSFFKTEFISDGLFNSAFGGIGDLSQKLEIGKFVDGVVLAREQVRYSQNPSLENVTTADMSLEISVLSVSATVQNQTRTFTATGAGFKNENARASAEERLVKEIMSDTNMTLIASP
jgi:hypothetical protein